MNAEALALIAFAALTVGGVALAAFGPTLRSDPLRARVDILADERADGQSSGGGTHKGSQGKSVKKVLREIEEVQRKRSRRTLALRLRQAGLDVSRTAWAGVMIALGLLGGLLALSFGFPPWIAACIALAAAGLAPELYLRFLRGRRLKQMAQEFPNAIDVVVRGVKSGLPLPDGLRIISTEAQEPLRSEFAKIVRDQTAGLPIADAVERFAQRVPLPEANFFAIVITIQSRTGGSLSESLSNLATVLRERKKMQGKIKAMSSEAKASGAIIGSLPIVVSTIIYLTSPDYMRLLFETFAGNVVIAGSALWMMIGVLVMKKMINFDF